MFGVFNSIEAYAIMLLLLCQYLISFTCVFIFSVLFFCMEKKHLTFNLDSQIVKKLKLLAVNEDKTVTDLLIEAIGDLFTKYENPSEITETTAEQQVEEKKVTRSVARMPRKIAL